MRLSILSLSRRRLVWLTGVLAVLAALLGSMVTVGPAQALSDTGTGGQFVTASGRLINAVSVSANTWTTVQVTGTAGIPNDGTAGSVVLNATVAGAPGVGQLFGRPDSSTTSTLMVTYDGGGLGTTSGSSTIAIGSDGTVQVQANTTGKIYLDVEGYYTSVSGGVAPGGFVPVPGTRIVDTRSGLGAAKATLAPAGSVTIQVGGKGGVPTNASGVVANFLVINESSNSGYITPYTTGASRPGTSLNYAPGAGVPTSDTAQVKLSSSGQVTVYNASGAAGTIDVVVDVQGYFTAAGSGTGAVFTPASGLVYSTRTTGNTAVAANSNRAISIAGAAGIPVMGSGITAVALRVEARHAAMTTGDATVWADGTTKPGTTTVNFTGDSIRDNTAIVSLGTNGMIDIYNRSSDSTDFLIYLEGWYVNPQAPTISCDSPYENGTWTSQTSSDDTACDITFAPTSSSVEPIITVDGDEVGPETTDDVPATSFGLSSTSPTTITEWDGGDAGIHTIDVVDPSGAESVYTYGVGAWSSAPLLSISQAIDSSTVNDLSVISSTDEIPDGANYDFHIINATGAAVADSGPVSSDDGDHSGEWTIPDGTLDPDTQYQWYVDVTAASQPAIGSQAAGPAVTVKSDTADLAADGPEPSDPAEGTQASTSPSTGFSAQAVRACEYGIDTDLPHVSKDKTHKYGEASVHGWWINVNCKDTGKATITVQLQRSIGGKWVAIGAKGEGKYKPGGGAGKRATSRHVCASTKQYTYRGHTTASIPNVKMTATTNSGNMNTFGCG